MNVIFSNGRYQIFNDGLVSYDNLPVETYEVKFDKMSGFYLSSHEELKITEEKIYGDTERKVKKVLDGFNASDRNFGVILSGKKGIGKSLFAKVLSCAGISKGIPVILVNSYVPGISNFLSCIKQEVIVLFDEFEKTFKQGDDFNPQDELLTLFDGIDGGKKLFVITCNQVNRLNDYLLNRPGRFHYHFIIKNPSPEEVREYMTDKLLPEYHNTIKKIVDFSTYFDVSYDVLRAIAFEINMGYPIEETLSDLNINKEETPTYTVKVSFSDGTERISKNIDIDVFSPDTKTVWLNGRGNKYADVIGIRFNTSDLSLDDSGLSLYLNPDNVETVFDDYYEDDYEDRYKKLYEYLNSLKISNIEFIKNHSNSWIEKYAV